jgi:pimeloyl-ACP methyl ester carboxylesterase
MNSTKVFLSNRKLWILLTLTISLCSLFVIKTIPNKPNLSKRGVIGGILDSKETIDWIACDEFYYGRIKVPMNVNQDFLGNIKISLLKYPAVNDGKKRSALVVFPDGPGVSGIAYVLESGKKIAKLFDNQFDIIGFDQRGVGASSPVKCISQYQSDRYEMGLKTYGAPFLPKVLTEDQAIFYDASLKMNAHLYVTNSFPLLIHHLSMQYNAQDLESIRKHLGLELLNYWGIGYGALLGLTYANMYPDTVGKMILDNPITPYDYFDDVFSLIRGVTVDTIKSVKFVLEDCHNSPQCPLNNVEKSTKVSYRQIENLIDDLRNDAAVIDNTKIPGVLTAEMVESLIFEYLHIPSFWPVLNAALHKAINGNLEDLYNLSLNQKKKDSRNRSRKMAFLCADGLNVTDIEIKEWIDRVSKLESYQSARARILGSYYLSCRHWKLKPQERWTGPWNNNIKNNILMIGYEYNPIIPFSSVQETMNLLQNNRRNSDSVLIRQNGFGHGLLSNPTSCLQDYVFNYMINGIMPPKNSICQLERE